MSIPSNIAEGQGRGNDKQFAYFLRIAYGSLREVETQIEIAQRLGYLDDASSETLYSLADEAGRLINGLRNSL